MIDKIEKKKCTGCKLCGDVCPNHAINFKTDSQGFWYPNIDAERCNQCELCELKCPCLNPPYNSERNAPKIYAAWSKNSDVRYQSTSGGIFWELASNFLKSGGVVVGSRWGSDWKSAEHVIAHSVDELTALRGSKYIQSDTEGIYGKIYAEIKNGIPVLFCGTPCQNAAVQKYIGEAEENIYYMDFICRSINSPMALREFVNEKERVYDSSAVNVHLKDKTKGWESLASRIIFENGEQYLRDKNDDVWIRGFLDGDLYTRESCFSCQYRTLPRNIADITVGDFWGIDEEAAYDMFRGISVVMINTFKGEYLFEKAKSNLFYKEKKLEDVLGGNPALLNNPIQNGNRDKFFEILSKKGFTEGVKEILGEPWHPINHSRLPQEIYEEYVSRYKWTGRIDKELYFYLNFESKNVVHNGKGRIIPYQNVVLDLYPTAKIVINGDNDFEIGTNMPDGSKSETLIRMEYDSVWTIRHGGYLTNGTTLELKHDAEFDCGYFSMNTGSVLIATKKIIFGEDVMIGRNVIIYDSDFHQIHDDKGDCINPPQEVVIEDHVWLTCNVNVNKGVRIGVGSIIAQQTVVTKNIPPYSLVAGQSVGRVIKRDVRWSRKSYKPEYKTRSIILYGYGIEGKKFYKKHKERISFIIDNYDESDCVLNFKSFRNNHQTMDEDKYLWVIASPNHFDELYKDIRNGYPDALVVSYSELN